MQLSDSSFADSGFFDSVDLLGGVYVYNAGASFDAHGVSFVNNINGMGIDGIGSVSCAQCQFEGNKWDLKIGVGLVWTDSVLDGLKIDEYETWKFYPLEKVADEIGSKGNNTDFVSLRQVCFVPAYMDFILLVGLFEGCQVLELLRNTLARTVLCTLFAPLSTVHIKYNAILAS